MFLDMQLDGDGAVAVVKLRWKIVSVTRALVRARTQPLSLPNTGSKLGVCLGHVTCCTSLDDEGHITYITSHHTPMQTDICGVRFDACMHRQMNAYDIGDYLFRGLTQVHDQIDTYSRPLIRHNLKHGSAIT